MTRIHFFFHNDNLLLLPGAKGAAALPSVPASLALPQSLVHQVGEWQGIPCLACQVDLADPAAQALLVKETPLLETRAALAEVSLRSAADILGPGLHGLAGKARELIHWDANSRFCAACGATMLRAGDIFKRCPDCGREVFPHITVAVLALVRKENDALLVRARNFTGPFYGLVAGYLETGESLEACVRREVREETGLEIANVRYFGSQPWPYPSGLMVGYVADYAGGDIVLQEEELLEAAFFSRDRLPELPPRLSLTRQMIDAWVTGELDPAKG